MFIFLHKMINHRDANLQKGRTVALKGTFSQDAI